MVKYLELLSCPECFVAGDLCDPGRCGKACLKHCPRGAVSIENGRAEFDLKRCDSCSRCAFVCPFSAITKNELVRSSGEGGESLFCCRCQCHYPVREGIPILLPKVSLGSFKDSRSSVPLSPGKDTGKRMELKFFSYNYYLRHRDFVAKAADLDDGVVIDLGCGTGSVSGCFREYIGFDSSWRSLLSARRFYPEKTFVLADAAFLPLRTASVKRFVSRHLLEHIHNDEQILREAGRAVSSGEGLVELPSKDGVSFVFDPLNWLLLRQGRAPVRFGSFGYGHTNMNTVGEWKEKFRACGFETQAEYPVGRGLLVCLCAFLESLVFSYFDTDRLPLMSMPGSLFRVAERLFRGLSAADFKDIKTFCRLYRLTKAASVSI